MEITNEKQLQYQCVKWFNETYPDKYGLLFATQQTQESCQQAAQRKAQGMVAGVSDLIYLGDKLTIFCEMKLKGKSHSKEHIQRQYEWGKKVQTHCKASLYVIFTTFEGWQRWWRWYFGDAACYGKNDTVYLKDLEEMLKTDKKTIKF